VEGVVEEESDLSVRIILAKKMHVLTISLSKSSSKSSAIYSQRPQLVRANLAGATSVAILASKVGCTKRTSILTIQIQR
jgi:hypothetical protein